ncbi:MAG TPA: alkaline phosphatase family protein, partial [Gemmatimonadaceae bacterium]|nr:alkaline phosphatase family protein [Gemmatimonadaceae bacterium]
MEREQPAANLVPNQTMLTIGDRLTAANVSWAWYARGWNSALAGNADPLFQFHDQPFAYFANDADGTSAKAAHLEDETDFMAAASAGALPAVSDHLTLCQPRVSQQDQLRDGINPRPHRSTLEPDPARNTRRGGRESHQRVRLHAVGKIGVLGVYRKRRVG